MRKLYYVAKGSNIMNIQTFSLEIISLFVYKLQNRQQIINYYITVSHIDSEAYNYNCKNRKYAVSLHASQEIQQIHAFSSWNNRDLTVLDNAFGYVRCLLHVSQDYLILDGPCHTLLPTTFLWMENVSRLSF